MPQKILARLSVCTLVHSYYSELYSLGYSAGRKSFSIIWRAYYVYERVSTTQTSNVSLQQRFDWRRSII